MPSLQPAARRVVQSVDINGPTCDTWRMLKAEFEGHTSLSVIQNLEAIFTDAMTLKLALQLLLQITSIIFVVSLLEVYLFMSRLKSMHYSRHYLYSITHFATA